MSANPGLRLAPDDVLGSALPPGPYRTRVGMARLAAMWHFGDK
jgi:hypothetical protein